MTPWWWTPAPAPATTSRRCWRRCPDAVGLALDVSKPALRRAARAHPRAAAALADTWQRLPLADASTAVLLNVFAPRNGAGVPPGAATRTARCWWSPRPRPPRRTGRRARPAPGRPGQGRPGRRQPRRGTSPQDVARSRCAGPRLAPDPRRRSATLVGMGPSAWHTDPARLADADRRAARAGRRSTAARSGCGVHRPALTRLRWRGRPLPSRAARRGTARGGPPPTPAPSAAGRSRCASTSPGSARPARSASRYAQSRQ